MSHSDCLVYTDGKVSGFLEGPVKQKEASQHAERIFCQNPNVKHIKIEMSSGYYHAFRRDDSLIIIIASDEGISAWRRKINFSLGEAECLFQSPA